jgi:hypothetical protein
VIDAVCIMRLLPTLISDTAVMVDDCTHDRKSGSTTDDVEVQSSSIYFFSTSHEPDLFFDDLLGYPRWRAARLPRCRPCWGQSAQMGFPIRLLIVHLGTNICLIGHELLRGMANWNSMLRPHDNRPYEDQIYPCRYNSEILDLFLLQFHPKV